MGYADWASNWNKGMEPSVSGPPGFPHSLLQGEAEYTHTSVAPSSTPAGGAAGR